MAGRPVLAAGLAEGRVNVPQAQVIVRALVSTLPSGIPDPRTFVRGHAEIR